MARIFFGPVPVDNVIMTTAIDLAVTWLRGDRGHFIATVNPEMVVAAQHDPAFLTALQRADLALADGMGLWLASRLLGQPLAERVPGVDFIIQLISRAETHGASVYLLGGAAGVAELAKQTLQQLFPRLLIVGAESGGVLRPEQWNEAVTADVAAAAPSIVLVAFGHGKQERWIVDHLSQLPSVRIAIGVGGTLNFLAGTAKRAPKIFRGLGLEWLWRVFRPNRDAYLDPWRFKRIWRATCVFSWLVVQWKWHSLWQRRIGPLMHH
ncbi:MAG: WecB/TagA/CpsF family glycosyltransferase [Patescibacteria group bacterium]